MDTPLQGTHYHEVKGMHMVHPLAKGCLSSKDRIVWQRRKSSLRGTAIPVCSERRATLSAPVSSTVSAATRPQSSSRYVSRSHTPGWGHQGQTPPWTDRTTWDLPWKDPDGCRSCATWSGQGTPRGDWVQAFRATKQGNEISTSRTPWHMDHPTIKPDTHSARTYQAVLLSFRIKTTLTFQGYAHAQWVDWKL